MKKLLLLSAVIFSLLLVAGCGTKKADISDTGTTAQTTGATTAKDATKDECLELMAYAFKVAQLQALWNTAGMSTRAQKASDLELKYRAEGREYEEACNKYLANTNDMSFYTEVQKRVKELK